jgi:hypothetical protein
MGASRVLRFQPRLKVRVLVRVYVHVTQRGRLLHIISFESAAVFTYLLLSAAAERP